MKSPPNDDSSSASGKFLLRRRLARKMAPIARPTAPTTPTVTPTIPPVPRTVGEAACEVSVGRESVVVDCVAVVIVIVVVELIDDADVVIGRVAVAREELDCVLDGDITPVIVDEVLRDVVLVDGTLLGVEMMIDPVPVGRWTNVADNGT